MDFIKFDKVLITSGYYKNNVGVVDTVTDECYHVIINSTGLHTSCVIFPKNNFEAIKVDKNFIPKNHHL